jgi:uroporphyrin-III C-methyltransferase/precorrin-2 dehydrogenase/sirohydrochlorin ferrochelatase
MRYLPVFLDLAQGEVLLVGAAEPALNKLRLLLGAGARVRWFRDDTNEPLPDLPSGARVTIARGDPLWVDLAGVVAIVSAAGAPLDDAVAQRARTARIPVNVVDRTDLSSFIFGSIIDRGEVVVAVGTGGAAPVLARRLRERIEALLPARVGDLASLVGRYRSRVAERLEFPLRRKFWERVIDGPVAAHVLAGREREAEAELTRLVGDASSDAPSGIVHLVGAGPGDPDLLTLRALQALQDADVVFYDELVTNGILDRARRDAAREFVGKKRGAPGIGQEAINRRLLEAARAGKRVVRLKGGDPFVFGRGGEELQFLRAAGIAVVVVPGVTAALGCAAEAGLPLTYRNESSRLLFITAHRAEEQANVDWRGLADDQTTVVAYMGLAAAPSVRDGLIAAGRDPETPAAVLARGTRPDAQAAVGPLRELDAMARSVGEGPALIVIGKVVARSTPWRAAELENLVGEMRDAA